MSSLVYDSFGLVLTGSIVFILDHIKECSGFSKTIAKKGLKFFSYDEYSSIVFNLLLILLPTI